MVDFFIHRPVFSTVCALLIILAGATVIPTLPIAQFPDLAPPQVSVSSFYTGASAQTVESAVTTPLEQQINGAEGMKYITSSSSNDGVSQITATFDLNREPDLASVDIQNRVNTALGRLPNAVKQVGVTVQKSSQNFVFGAAVFSPDNRYSTLFMSNYLDVYVRDNLKRVPGVAEVFIFGERKYSMRLWLDPVRMASRSLTAPDVVNALAEQNVEVAAGQVGSQPSIPGQQFQISVRAIGRLSEPAQFDNIILKSNSDGTLVRLRDVGHAELGAESYGSNLDYNGREAVGLGITQLSTANALDVDRRCIAELARLAKRFPPGMKYELAFDTTDAVSESIRDVVGTLGAAIVLVVLVIFIFLEDWRSTIIPSVTIPVSLIGTFAFVKLLGFSINTLTLFGITLATGLVVDDAIVVIENIERHLQEGEKDPTKASSDAMKEVTGAVIATSLVLVAVFVPVAFFPGTTGILFRQFALTIAFSITISAFNALTLTPSLSALLLGRSHGKKNWFFQGVDRVIAAVTRGYVRALRAFLHYEAVALVLFFIGLGLAYFVFQRVPKGFVPNEDQGWAMVIIQAPSGASLEYTKKIGDQVTAITKNFPEIQGTFAVSGFSFGGSAPNRGIVFLSLKPYAQRQGKEHSASAIINRMRGPLFGITGAIVIPFEPPAVQGLGTFGGFQFEVQDQGSHTLQELDKATQNLIREGNSRKDLAGLFTSYTANDPQFVVTIDREKAKSLHVSLSQITETLSVYMGSAYINDFDFNNRSYRVYVQAEKEFRSHPQDIKEYYVRSESGAMIPLENLVAIGQTAAPQVISHYNLFRSTELSGAAAPGFSSGQAINAVEQLSAKVLPQGFTYEWSGISLEELQSGTTTLILFGLGTLVVYLTLSAQYESFVLPFIILLAVPMAILGALSAQWLRGQQNDVYCQVGLVMLVGLASKNAILIVEFAEQLRERGMTIVDAAVEAARIRLRPILMTSFAFILGVVPLVIASGAGENGRHSVGTTVFGGMIMSTILNLFFIPVLYLLIEGFRERRRTKTA
ncbi:MAG: multidrug efflux RND transporter permease subunit [Acidobacteriales bacterium]|nr:multidrug efflux RND transporter permease subunit [Candidatus Koribacter versatilis]MBI3646784.1 multidrug efflux RND transporter permease subunit [Terriglobales bacterium]